jgi:hypothetical protein
MWRLISTLLLTQSAPGGHRARKIVVTFVFLVTSW